MVHVPLDDCHDVDEEYATFDPIRTMNITEPNREIKSLYVPKKCMVFTSVSRLHLCPPLT